MDVMDAINISLSGDETGSALWYIFPADKVDTLRDYLNNRYKDIPNAPTGDIIHSGCVVFDEEMLQDLAQKTYLVPWVIHQQPGDMVFVPSRCPHMVSGMSTNHRGCIPTSQVFQVRNEVWAIKTAIDFLSGEALVRTAHVAEELRKYRFVDENLEDVLQLHLVLWHAWVSISQEMEGVLKAEVEKRKAGHGTGDRERVFKARKT